MRNTGTILWHLSSGDQFLAVKDHEELPIKTVSIWQITTFVFSLNIYQVDRALIPDAWMKVCMNKLINQLWSVLNHLSYWNRKYQCALLHLLILHYWSGMCLCWDITAMGQTTNSKSSVIEILLSFSWELLALHFDLCGSGGLYILHLALENLRSWLYLLTQGGCTVSLKSVGTLLLKSLAFQRMETDSKNTSYFKVLN